MTTVVAGVFAQGGRVLVCRRAAGREHAGKWEFPGGKVEAGETPAAALARELREELAVEAEVGGELRRLVHRYPGSPPIEIVFLRVDELVGALDAGHFAEVRWVETGRLEEIDFLDADRSFVAELASGRLA